MSSKCKNENGCKYCKIGSNNQCIFCDYVWALQVWLWSLYVCHGTSPWSSSTNMATTKTHTKMKNKQNTSSATTTTK